MIGGVEKGFPAAFVSDHQSTIEGEVVAAGRLELENSGHPNL
jgi:hypothetical protein